MLSPTALSWGIIAKSYKHGMVLRDISCYLFRVSWFLDDVRANKRASYHAQLILAVTSTRVELGSQNRVENQRIHNSG